MVILKRTNSLDTDLPPLIKLLDDGLTEQYGDLMADYNPHNILPYIDTVVIAYLNDKPIGCGAFKAFDEHAVEIKRMFVHADARGKGIATKILTELEVWAKSLGYTHTVLETGHKQFDAVALYQKLNYVLTEKYGQYVDMESSICMRKEL